MVKTRHIAVWGGSFNPLPCAKFALKPVHTGMKVERGNDENRCNKSRYNHP